MTICATIDSGELLSRLNDSAVAGAWEEDGLLHLYWSEGAWNALAAEDISVSRVPEKDGWIALESAAMESCEA